MKTIEELEEAFAYAVLGADMMPTALGDLIREVQTEASAAEREACAKIACLQCRTGHLVEIHDGDFCHRSTYSSQTLFICDANEIHKRKAFDANIRTTSEEG